MDLTVQVVHYGPPDGLMPLVRSLRSAVGPRLRFELVVVHNGGGPSPRRGHLVAACRAPVRLIIPGENLGYGKAHNVALAIGRAPAVALLNPDLDLPPGALGRLVDSLWSHSRAGVVGPSLSATGTMPAAAERVASSSSNGERKPRPRDVPAGAGRGWPGLAQTVFEELGVHRVWVDNPVKRRYLTPAVQPGGGPVDWLVGACLVARRVALEDVGGFDPAFLFYHEDTDLGRRLARAGWESHMVPSVRVGHVGGATGAGVRDDLEPLFWEGQLRLAHRHGGAGSLAACWALGVAGSVLRLTVSGARGMGAAGSGRPLRAAWRADCDSTDHSAARRAWRRLIWLLGRPFSDPPRLPPA